MQTNHRQRNSRPACAVRLAAGILSVALVITTYAQTTDSAAPVSREEHNSLVKELDAVKAQLATLQTNVAAQQADNEEALKDVDKQSKALKDMAGAATPGTSKMLLAGYGAVSYQNTSRTFGPAQPVGEITDEPRSRSSTFSAAFNPLFAWALGDATLFESEFEGEIGADGEVVIKVEYAHINYALCDYSTLVAGKFLNPMNYFVERQHQAWINKLPDLPLVVYDGLLPEAILGAELRGVLPLGETKAEYSLFTGNAPTLAIPANDLQQGLISYDALNTARVSTGGRIGLFLMPQCEIGYGAQNPNLADGVGSLLQSVDLNYRQDCAPVKGVLDFKTQWVWSHVDAYTVDPTTEEVVDLPAGLNNNLDGGYVQLSYRPTQVNGPVKNVEPVVRYDVLNAQSTAIGYDDHRSTIGLAYWLNATASVKAAYESDRQNGSGQNGHAILVQTVVGF